MIGRRRRRPQMADRDVVGDQPVPVLRKRRPAGEDEATARFQCAADVAKCRDRIGEEHDAHARRRDIECRLLECHHLRIAERQFDVVHPALVDPLPGDRRASVARCRPRRRGHARRPPPRAAASPRRCRSRSPARSRRRRAPGTSSSSARLSSIAPLAEPRAGDPARAGDRVPIVPHGFVRVRDCRSLADLLLDWLLSDQKEFRV